MSSARLSDRIIARVAAFSLVGAANGIVGVGVILTTGLLGAKPILANVLGYAAGLLVSFVLNSKLTFRSRLVDRGTLARFLVTFVVAFAANLAMVKVTTDLTASHKLLTSLAGTPIYVGVFYLLCEFWVFQHHPDGN